VTLSALNNDQVHAVAAHLVVAEAIIKTRLPADVVPEERRYRVRIGGRLAQVASRRTGDWQIGDVNRPLAPGTELMILVDFAPELPEFYPIPGDWFVQDIRKRYDTYLQRVVERPRNPDSKHYRVLTSHVAQWWGKWDALR
jgi:hypothetical protein